MPKVHIHLHRKTRDAEGRMPEIVKVGARWVLLGVSGEELASAYDKKLLARRLEKARADWMYSKKTGDACSCGGSCSKCRAE